MMRSWNGGGKRFPRRARDDRVQQAESIPVVRVVRARHAFGGVAHEVPDENRSGTRQDDSVLRDRIVERDLAFVDQLEDHRAGERLRQRREVKDRRVADLPWCIAAERTAPDD